MKRKDKQRAEKYKYKRLKKLQKKARKEGVSGVSDSKQSHAGTSNRKISKTPQTRLIAESSPSTHPYIPLSPNHEGDNKPPSYIHSTAAQLNPPTPPLLDEPATSTEESHEQNLDTLLSLHFERTTPPAPPNTYTPFHPIQDIDFDTDPPFLQALTHEQSLLFTFIDSLETKLQFQLDGSTDVDERRLQKALRLSSTLCFGLFVAEYAMRDILACSKGDGGVGVRGDEEVEEVKSSVGVMVGIYDEGMKKMGMEVQK
jgi:hypothetical protein